MSLKNKINLSIAIFIILTIGFIVFFIYPLFSEIKKISQDFLFQRQKLITLEKKVENLEKLKTNFEEISPALEKIDSLFIDPKVPLEFILFLEKNSQESDLLLKILSPKTEKNFLSFQLTLVGSFSNFSKFLEKVESSLYLIEIENLNIAKLTETELKSKEFEKFSLGDVKANLLIKVQTK